jgi:hypothetical protein
LPVQTITLGPGVFQNTFGERLASSQEVDNIISLVQREGPHWQGFRYGGISNPGKLEITCIDAQDLPAHGTRAGQWRYASVVDRKQEAI